MSEVEYQIPVKVTREAVARVIARNASAARYLLDRGQWQELVYTQDERLADVTPTGPALATDEWRNPS